MASFSSTFPASRAEDLPPSRTIRTTLRTWAAELAPFPDRWRRAARVAFITAVGAAVMASMQIGNPLGLTLLVSFAAPEFAFSLATGIIFLIAAAATQIITLTAVGALADNAALHICVFIAFTALSTYLIYGVPQFGRLWVWVQIPAVTAFYAVLFDHRALGWDSAQMLAGVTIALLLLWVFNNVIWPEPAAAVLMRSLGSTLERSRHRLNVLIAIFLGEVDAEDDRRVASKLAYHLALLHPATRQAKSVHEAAKMLAAVTVAERIDNAIDRLAAVAGTQSGAACNSDIRRDLLQASAALGDALENYIIAVGHQLEPLDRQHPLDQCVAAIGRLRAEDIEPRSLGDVASHLAAIAQLLVDDPAELPDQSAARPFRPLGPRPFRSNKFLVRFCIRHTIAITIAFVAGLFDNSAALHAALWLLMIGGPPSHGATARKFTTRAIGASGALIFAALATIILAPNFTTLPPYVAAIFVGVLLMTYIGEGGGALSYLSIGSTAFVIAFSGPGPRPDMLGSIWTIWGISLGMIIRAIISAVSIERPNRTLAEEIENPLSALVQLVPGSEQDFERVAIAEKEVIGGIEEMLNVAADAQLEGRPIGIDARNLVDALDTMRRLAFVLGNLSYRELDTAGESDRAARASRDDFYAAVREHLAQWLASTRAQLEPGQLTPAPLRTMVAEAGAIDQTAGSARLRAPIPESDQPAREHILTLIRTLENQLAIVSLFGERGGDGGMPLATD